MKTALNLRFLFALGVALIAGCALYLSLDWPFRTALFPRVLGAPLLFLALTEMFLSAFGAGEQREAQAVDFQLATDVDPILARKRSLAISAWILTFFILILLTGFPLGVPLFVFLYLKVAGRERWVLTLSLTALSWLFMEGLFERLLHIPFPQGWIFSLWG